jgi:hypothetical protein
LLEKINRGNELNNELKNYINYENIDDFEKFYNEMNIKLMNNTDFD